MQVPHTAGMTETDLLQVFVLCPKFFLLAPHIPTPVFLDRVTTAVHKPAIASIPS